MPRKPAFISHSREREAEIQARLLAVLEARFRRRIAQEIAREMGAILATYQASEVIPPVSEQHAQNMRAIYADLALRSALVFGRRIISQGKAVTPDLESKEEGFFTRLYRSLASAWVNLEPVRRRIQSVTETTRNGIVREVETGQRDGLGIDAIARGISDNVPSIARMRAALIARTETHGAANFASYNTALQTGLDLRKEWVSVIDMRTRSFGENDEFDHLAMDGQTVAMDEPFLMPWRKGPPIPAMYPGEASLPPGACINCRCAVVYTVDGLD